jgi:hypothetical protein
MVCAKLLVGCFVSVSLAHASCGGGGGGGGGSTSVPAPNTGTPTPSPTPSPTPTPTPAVSLTNPADWEIGPIIDGKNYSHNVPLHPTPEAMFGWHIDFPQSDGVHYVTRHFGSLSGKTKITMHYRIEMDDGVKIVPSTAPKLPSIGPVLYFQREHDNWASDGWRWWATFNAPIPIVAGEFELSVPLDGAWTSVETKTSANSPGDFFDAKQYADRIGFTLGGGTGYGHGVYATGPARIVVTEFKVE